MRSKPKKEKHELESSESWSAAISLRAIQLLKSLKDSRSFLEQLFQGVSTNSVGSSENRTQSPIT